MDPAAGGVPIAAGGLVPSDSGLNDAASIKLYACVTVACELFL